MRRLQLSLPLAVLSLMLLFSCQGQTNTVGESEAHETGKPQTGLPEVVLSSRIGELVVELAVTDQEKNIGLMYRTALADGRGMLFVYQSDQRLSYWMKNTLIPLSIAYLAADGTIREIYDMQPESLAPVSSTRSVRYALEVPQGWFGRVGLGPGDRFAIPDNVGIKK